MEMVEDELERMKGSLSWRVTGPLRWIAQRLRGGRPKQVKVDRAGGLCRRPCPPGRRMPSPVGTQDER